MGCQASGVSCHHDSVQSGHEAQMSSVVDKVDNREPDSLSITSLIAQLVKNQPAMQETQV